MIGLTARALIAGLTLTPRKPASSWRHWFDYDHTIWLVFLGFWFLDPYLNHAPLHKWLWLILAIALFIPLYLFSHNGPLRFRWVGVLGMLSWPSFTCRSTRAPGGIFIYLAVSLPEVPNRRIR